MERFQKITWPFSPDIIVYCKSNYLFIGEHMEAELVQAACEQFEQTHGYYPKVIIEEKGGLIVLEEIPLPEHISVAMVVNDCLFLCEVLNRQNVSSTNPVNFC